MLALEDLLQNETRETSSLKQQLLDERKENDALTKEIKTLQNQSDKKDGASDVEITETMKQLHISNEKIEELNERVKNLESDKQKLINRLKEADASFKSLSRRASHPGANKEVEIDTTAPSKYTMDYVMKYMGKQLKLNLDQITNTVQQISTKEMTSRKELLKLKDELHRVTLLLSEEKLKHDQVKTINNELEETLNVMTEFEEQKAKICDDLTQLRKEHKKCALIETALKQTKREKKSLFRKHETLKQKFEILRILHETLKEELVAKDMKLKEEISGDFLNNKPNVDKNTVVIADLRNELAEKEQALEMRDSAHCQKLEELKMLRIEMNKLKADTNLKENPSLENLNRSINDVRNCLTDIKSEKSQKYEDVEQLNAKLRADVAHLGERLSEKEEEMETLKGKITQMDITKLEHESEIGKLTEDLERSRLSKKHVDEKTVSEKTSQIVENLQLEKDILSSRVLILEGIGEDIEILKQERDQLKELNEELKEKLHGKLKVKGCYSDGDVSRFGPIKIKDQKKGFKQKERRKKEELKEDEYDDDDNDDDILDTIKSISCLDENDKHRLQDMLSHPMFENFLANSSSSMFDLGDLKIDQPSDTSVQDQGDETVDEENVTHRESMSPTSPQYGSPEYVQQIYVQECESDLQVNQITESESEDTIDYSKRIATAESYEEEEEEDSHYNEDGEDNESIPHKNSLKEFEKLKKNHKYVGSKKKGRRIRKTSKKNLNIRASSDDVFEKVHRLSSENESYPTSLQKELSSMKQVKFSDDHIETDYIKEQDDELFRSYLRECLQTQYPILTENSEASIEKELNYVSSFTPESVSPLEIDRDSPILKAEKILSEDGYSWKNQKQNEKEFYSIHDRFKNVYDPLIDQGYNSTTSSNCRFTVNNSSSQLDAKSADLANNKELFDIYRKACMEFDEKKRVASDALKALKSVMTDADIGDLESCLHNSTTEVS